MHDAPMPRRTAPPPANVRAVVYARVSSDEQAESGYSLDAQLELMRSYATAKGLVIEAEHVAAESAREQGRVEFGRVLTLLRAKGGPGHLLVDKVDRGGRNLPDMAALDELRARGLAIHAVRTHRVYGPDSSPADLLDWEFNAMLARHFSRNLGEETKKGMKAKRSKGGWCHLAPLGLLNATRDKRAAVIHDPERAPLIRELFRAVAADAMTLAAACEWAARAGLTTRADNAIKPSPMQKILRNPLMAGMLIAEDGSMQRADFEPIIDAATWWFVQDVLSSRTRGKGERGRRHDHVFRGLVRCACGRALSGELQAGRHGKGAHVYYRCTAHQCPRGRQSVKEQDLVEAVARRLDRLKLTPEARENVRADVAELVALANASARESLARLDAESRTRNARLATMYQDRLSGRLEPDSFDAMAALERRRLATIDAERSNVRVADSSWADDAIAICDAAVAAGAGLRRSSREHMRDHVRRILGAPIVVGEALSVTLHVALERAIRPNPEQLTVGQQLTAHRTGDIPSGSGQSTLPEPPPAEVWEALRALAAA